MSSLPIGVTFVKPVQDQDSGNVNMESSGASRASVLARNYSQLVNAGRRILCFQSVSIDRFARVHMEVGSFSGMWVTLNGLSRSVMKRNRHEDMKEVGKWRGK